MLHQCKFKRFLSLWLVSILLSSVTGCSAKVENTISVGEWISLLDEKAGIYDYSSDEPYFMNVPADSPYFSSVQAAVEWQVIETDIRLEMEDALTREWVAYTLMNLAQMSTDKSTNNQINDLSKSQFPQQVILAYQSGLMNLDSYHRFLPTKTIDKDEAVALLDEVVSFINNRTFEKTESRVNYCEDVQLTDEKPISLDATQKTAAFLNDALIETDTVFSYETAQEETKYYRISSVLEEGDSETIVSIEEVDFEDVVEDFSFSDDFEMNFTQAEITDLTDDFVIYDGDTLTDITPVAYRGNAFRFDKQKTINGFTLSYYVSGSSLKAQIKKSSVLGSTIYANCTISSIKPTVNFDYSSGLLKNGYFKVSFDSSQSIGIRNGIYKTLYGDLKSLSGQDFLSSLTNLWKTKKEIQQVEIPLCEVKIPIPSCPTAKITIRLQLRIYTSGKAEIVLDQSHCYGMEIRDGKARLIHDFSPSAKAVIQASTSVMAGIRFGAEILSAKIADMTLEAGAKALVSTTAHLFDAEGNDTESSSDVSYDVALESSTDTSNPLFCGDLKAYWVAQIVFNSSKTLLGKLGISHTITLLDESNGKLIPHMKTHIENGLFVDHCTRNAKTTTATGNGIKVTDQIKLSSYSFSVKEKESKTIEIKGLPQGYGVDDLVYTPEDTSIVSVEDGVMTGLKSGSTKIHISTSDQAYSIDIMVLVKTPV